MHHVQTDHGNLPQTQHQENNASRQTYNQHSLATSGCLISGLWIVVRGCILRVYRETHAFADRTLERESGVHVLDIDSVLPLLYVAVVVEAGMSEETHAVKLDPSANCNGGFTVKMNYTELL
jgi:hypothetical protein